MQARSEETLDALEAQIVGGEDNGEAKDGAKPEASSPAPNGSEQAKAMYEDVLENAVILKIIDNTHAGWKLLFERTHSNNQSDLTEDDNLEDIEILKTLWDSGHEAASQSPPHAPALQAPAAG